MAVVNAKGEWGLRTTQAENDRFYYMADKQYQGKIDAANATAENDKSKQEQKLEDEKQKLHDEANIKMQQSFIQP